MVLRPLLRCLRSAEGLRCGPGAHDSRRRGPGTRPVRRRAGARPGDRGSVRLEPPTPDACDLTRARRLFALVAALEHGLRGPHPARRLRVGARLPGPGGAVRCELVVEDATHPPTADANPAATLLVVSVGRAPRRDALLVAAAAAEIAEAWHLDAPEGWLERYRAPSEGRYRLRDLFYPGAPLEIPRGGRVIVPG